MPTTSSSLDDLLDAMLNGWSFVERPVARERENEAVRDRVPCNAWLLGQEAGTWRDSDAVLRSTAFVKRLVGRRVRAERPGSGIFGRLVEPKTRASPGAIAAH